MKVNENTAISTAGVLLVPYESRHVPTYHAWMEDEAIRTATASDRLTLDEEYENQVSWRAAADKLTFILCQPLGEGRESVAAGVDDVPDRMVGDINFFLYPYEEDDDDDDGDDGSSRPRFYSGEVDIMIARLEHRGKGLGRAAVTAFLHYILEQKRAAILDEAATAEASTQPAQPALPARPARPAQPAQLKQLMVKIQATNEASIGLFKSLGFQQKGGVNYFGEVELVRADLDAPAPTAYAEKVYERTDA